MTHNRQISVIGLGYVGLPVAVAFSHEAIRTVAFDIDQSRIAELARGYDRTSEVSADALTAANLALTSDADDLTTADFHIVTVPTPIDENNKPDLGPLYAASETIGKQIKKGDIVVYESTVYPGATYEECVPVLEASSGLILDQDFSVGYSPERINPGDDEHRFENIVKVVSASNPDALETIAQVYGSVVHAGIHRAPNIKTAEAAKVIENTQRDLNIALMNELSVIFDHLDIDTRAVLAAAGTKWNFLNFVPGLVGGHCIGVDPYYLTHRAEQAGYEPEVILAGRRMNDGMAKYIAGKIVEHFVKEGKNPAEQRIAVLGITFKENVPDIRNSKAIDLIQELKKLGFDVVAHDPVADPDQASNAATVDLVARASIGQVNAVVFAVSHLCYIDEGWDLVREILGGTGGMVVDIKSSLDANAVPDGVTLWRM